MRGLLGVLMACAVIGALGCKDDGDKKPVAKSQFARSSYQGPPLGNGNTYRPPPPVFFNPKCGNTELGRAVKEFSKAPSVEPVRGACNSYLYNQGRWKDTAEMRSYVQQRMATCRDPYVSRAIAEVYYTYTNAVCDIRLYHGARWNSYEELRGYVLDYFCTNAPPKNDLNRKDIICTNGETQRNR